MVLHTREYTNIESIIREEIDSVSIFNSLYEKAKFPSTYSVFVPDDTAFHVLHPVELAYLSTRFAKHDRENFLRRHASHKILYNKNLKGGGNITSLEGEKIYYKVNGTDILIDTANITQTDIVARNGFLPPSLKICTNGGIGVIHIISKLLIPSSVVFTPLKYLYGLHDYIFAETLAASDSFHLGNDSSIRQTIFAPIDSAYADSVNTEELLKSVQYNFVDEPIDLRNFKDGDLIETKYQLKSLNGAGQMIKITTVGNKILLNNEIEIISEPGIFLWNGRF